MTIPAENTATDASPVLSIAAPKSETVDTTGLDQLVETEINRVDNAARQTISTPVKAKDVMPKAEPEVGVQDKEAETEEPESEAAEAEPAESESQSETDAEAEATEPLKPKTAKRVEKLIGKLKDKDAQIAELESFKANSLARIQQQQMQVPQRPPERTPEYHSQAYWKLKQEGVEDTDPRQQQNIANYNRFNTEVLADQIKSSQRQEELATRARQTFANSMFEIHGEHPFLKPADNGYGFDIDPVSDVGKVMSRLAMQDGIPLANNEMALLLYAQKAEIQLMRQQSSGSAATVDTLKRKNAEAQVKGLAPGTRPAPPQPKSKEKKMADLEDAAVVRGDRYSRATLGEAALAADLGL